MNFREFFRASLEKIFLVPADSFDNVKGQFPIGFFIWDLEKVERFESILASVYTKNCVFHSFKHLYSYDNTEKINQWLHKFNLKNESSKIGVLIADARDFQNNNVVSIQSLKGTRHGIFININQKNLIETSVYFSVRKTIEATWLNDRDQFLFPNDGWQADIEFQNDCLTFTLFTNNIQSKFGINNWIPFTEKEVNAREKFESNFMTSFINGKLKQDTISNLFDTESQRTTPLIFSPEATEVFNAGRELWKYYHSQPKCKVNASLYDIREHFQGRNESGKMNNKSNDEIYSKLIANLRERLKLLADKIKPKVYEYGFLKE